MRTGSKKQEANSETNELLGFITYRISQVHPKLNAQAAHILRKHANLSLVQWRIISLLNAFGPGASSVDLINRTSMDKGLFSRSLKSLIADGFVLSETDASDQRRLLLTLTGKGEERYGQVIEIMRERQKHLLHNVSDEERCALFSALAKLELNARRKDF